MVEKSVVCTYAQELPDNWWALCFIYDNRTYKVVKRKANDPKVEDINVSGQFSPDNVRWELKFKGDATAPGCPLHEILGR